MPTAPRLSLCTWIQIAALATITGSANAAPPVLVIGTTTNPFTQYYSEILRAEGLNSFSYRDLATIAPADLSNHRLVLLGETALTPAQVSMFTTWVNGGGKLISMRPDKQLAGLLGLTDAGSTITEGYLLVNTSTGPGAGIVNQTIQFHGAADRYLLNGSSAIATLYTTATAATAYPAVTQHTVGAAGGEAAAFTYDLARSIIYTRQGNPAWSGQERDGQSPIRSNDLFFGGSSLDWVDRNRVHIPQADEQQRLLANLIAHMLRDRLPMPRLWYFPFFKKAVILMTGDDHAQGGTAGRFNAHLAASPAGCSVDNWECVRSTSYVYPSSPLTNAQAMSYTAQGFEVGLHPDVGCADWTPSLLASTYTAQIASWRNRYSGIPSPSTNRLHCLVWSDYDTQPQVELTNGIRLDTNYYYWSGDWIATLPGYFTGSGIPMKFARADGTTVDVYQAATQMTDESQQSYPAFVNALLDAAVGPQGYYAALTTNIHTDSSTGASQTISAQIVASAQARGVPVVSALQMLRWLDARNASAFSDLAWDGTALNFTLTPGANATGLRGMVPASFNGGGLTALTNNGAAVPYTLEVIKGVAYAVFPAAAGLHRAVYAGSSVAVTVSPATVSLGSGQTQQFTALVTGTGNTSVTWAINPVAGSISSTGVYTAPSTPTTGQVEVIAYSNADPSRSGTGSVQLLAAVTPPVISAVTTTGTPGGATVQWTTDESATTIVDYGTSPDQLTQRVTIAGTVTAHSAAITGLNAGARYYYRVTSADAEGIPATWPPSGTPAASFYASSLASLWTPTTVPGIPDSGDSGAVEIGMKFQATTSGYVTGLRFYKAAANTGVHVATLWSRTGTVLARITGAAETQSGWQEISFDTPVAITANTTYVMSYLAPVGRYPVNNSGFSSAVTSGPLRALANGEDGGNGVYRYSSVPVFPNLTYQASNYWVDVLFTTSIGPDTIPPSISGINATPTGTTAAITWTTDEASDSTVLYGTSAANLNLTATGNTNTTSHTVNLSGLTAGTTYYFRVQSKDAANNTAASPNPPAAPASFATTAPDTTPPVISAIAATPAGTTAVITWTTNEASDSTVRYGTSAANLNLTATGNSNTTSHTVNLSGLTAGVTYYYQVQSQDAAGNLATAPASPANFTTTAPDATPPVITAVVATPASDRVTITWTTNEPADSRVDYGTAPTLGQTAADATLVTSHSVTITGLAAATTYHYLAGSTDASGNTSQSPAPPSAPLTFTTTSAVTLWTTQTPATVSSSDTGAVELGLKFRSVTPGFVSGVRFYKGTGNTGTHTGHLWSSTGTLLATAAFSNETASGWQQANFPSPVSIQANTTYVISYHAPNGRYSLSSGYFNSSGFTNGPLTAPSTASAGGNGVYRYGASSSFPNSSWNGSNYWVDVVFTSVPPPPDTTPPVITAVAANPASTTAIITWTTDEASSSRVEYGTAPASLTSFSTSAGLVTSHAVTLTGLTAGQTYYYRVISADPANNTAVSPSGPPATFTTPATLSFWDNATVPLVVSDSDTSSVELGLKFRSDAAGEVTGIRFYKGPNNTGTHVGNLWSATGQLLATVTFIGETASGWQQALFAAPVTITANTTYVVSYHAPNGRYSVTNDYFTTQGVDKGPLHALRSGVDGSNGVYRYSGASIFPNLSYRNSNYWVDVIFRQQ